MQILFISPSFPNRLHRIRAWQLLESLTQNHEVHLVTLAWRKPPQAEHSELAKKCASITVVSESPLRGMFRALLGILTSQPLEVAYCNSSRMHNAVREITTEKTIDLIYVKRLRSAQFAIGSTIPVHIDVTDAMSKFYDIASGHAGFPSKWLYQIEASRYKKYEVYISTIFTSWITCSQPDAEYLKERLPTISVSVVPNGVDLEYFSWSKRKPIRHTLILSGLLSKFVNFEAAKYFVKEIFPKILEHIPDAHLMLVGPSNWRVKLLASKSKNITVTGFVPDLRPYIENAEIVCCPILTGTGTRNKILQAWAIGRPVVSTTIGAEGLLIKPNENIFIKDTPSDFAEMVVELCKDPLLEDTAVQSAYATVTKCYTIQAITQSLESALTKSSHETSSLV